MVKTLHMVLDGQDVGRLTQDGHGSTRVTATPTDGLPRVSLAFPSNGEPVKPKPTQAYVAGLLPDNERTRTAIADRHGVSPTSEFALIGAIGADCPGAIQFLTDDQRENPPAEDLEPITDHAIAERLRGFRSGGADWGAAGEHWSLGGAQSKFALRFEGGAWHQAAGAAASSHIIKPGIIGYDEQALIEHVSLAALRELGMNVAATEFVRFEDEAAIVIERFD